MGALIPWSKRKQEEKDETSDALVVHEEKHEIVERKPSNDIVIHKGKNGGAIVQVRNKEIMLAGERRKVDPYQLIRMIKRVTQEIGSYKSDDDVYATIVVRALRKARGDLVNILENEFGIHWQINDDTGASMFYM